MDWSRHGIIGPDRFGLVRLSAISGVDVPTIQRWQHRGAVPVEPIGRGKVRAYTLWDAMHLAIVAEMARLDLRLTGSGANLSHALMAFVQNHVRRDGDLSCLASVVLEPEGNDWLIHPIKEALAGRSCVVISLRRIADGVVARYAAR